MTHAQIQPIRYNSEHTPDLVNVQVAVDLSDETTQLLSTLPQFVEPTQSTYQLLSVQVQANLLDKKFAHLDAEAEYEYQKHLEAKLSEYSQTLSRPGALVNEPILLADAETVEASILLQLENFPKNLLVTGMHALPQQHRGWRIGSTSYALATHAPCSVLVVKRPPQSQSMLRVLFATDGSHQAREAAERLIQFLPKQTTNIALFTAIPVNTYVMPMMETYVDTSGLERALKGEATAYLSDTQAIFEKAGYRVEKAWFSLGDPVQQILEAATETEADLIVLGAHGHNNGLKDWLLGSVSGKILEYATPSVAIIRD